MTTNERVLQVLQRVSTALGAIGFPDGRIDYAASDRAYRELFALFALGMRDTWRAESGEPPPDETWSGPAEPLAPGEDWSDDAKARLHAVCGDLELLDSHSNHAWAAMRHYLLALPVLQQRDDEVGLVCVARALRAAVGSMQHESILDEELREPSAWAARRVRTAAPAVRDEFQLSLVDMVGRLRDPNGWSSDVASTLLELCRRADALAYRRAVPWLALARWALTALGQDEILAGEGLEPFFEILGLPVEALRDLVTRALDRAETAENGVYYPYGEPPSPAKLRAETAAAITTMREQLAR